MKAICFYFQVHQPYRVRSDYSFFNIGPDKKYWDDKKNKEILKKVSMKCYLPTNIILMDLIKRYGSKFKVSFSFSGIILEQFEKYAPETLESFKALVKTGNVELLCETYYHSLASIKSKKEFVDQVNKHKQKIENVFGITPTTFRNTELIFNNQIAKWAHELGFKTIITEGVERVLKWRKPNFVYKAKNLPDLNLLLKNYKLSDDIAFRFSNKNWKGYPLTAKKYSKWLTQIGNKSDVINLFMDYETFGEHQWEDSGIFQFLKDLPGEILKDNDDYSFMTPTDIINQFKDIGELDIPDYISWADKERDISAWLGNDMQTALADYLYSMEDTVLNSESDELIDEWRKLQTSDHYYYVSTKNMGDGDIHNYFSPYASPHEAFMLMTNVMNDFKFRLDQLQ